MNKTHRNIILPTLKQAYPELQFSLYRFENYTLDCLLTEHIKEQMRFWEEKEEMANKQIEFWRNEAKNAQDNQTELDNCRHDLMFETNIVGDKD